MKSLRATIACACLLGACGYGTGEREKPASVVLGGQERKPPPPRDEFSPITVEADSNDTQLTRDLSDEERGRLCAALEPAIALECELFAMGSALEQDALNESSYEMTCEEERTACITERSANCREELGAELCPASVGDVVSCYEGRANARGAAVSELDGFAFTCEDGLRQLLSAAWSAGTLQPAALTDEVRAACGHLSECVVGEPLPVVNADEDTPAVVNGDAGTPPVGDLDAGAPGPEDPEPANDAGRGNMLSDGGPFDGGSPATVSSASSGT